MTNQSIQASIKEWAKPLGLTYTLFKEKQPGPFLDLTPLLSAEDKAGYGPGLCLTIDTPEDNPLHAQIGFWIPAHGRKGTWCSLEDGAGEVSADWIPNFSDEKKLLGFIEGKTEKFLLQYVYDPALDECLEENGISYSISEHEGFCGEATQHDLTNWVFFEFSDLKGFDVTLGISGLGEAATFSKDEDGWIDFFEYESGLKSKRLFLKWIEKILEG
jgi:hypothetical protein